MIAGLQVRCHDPDRGRVDMGGRDLRELSLEQVRARIALVSQETWLFHGTVEDNIRMGKPDASADELRAAASAANAEGFILRLPQGYDTVVGERGVRLSGGQRQRIAIARALLRDAPILVLDEALSSVDAESEALIQAALDRLMRGRTTLVFAHRLSSVVGADRTLVLDQGRLVEQGTHMELLGRGGAYTRLMAGQARDGAGAVAVSARPTALAFDGDGAPPGTDGNQESADAIVGAEAVGWGTVLRTLLDKTRGYRGQLTLTFALGVARVTAFIGVGVLSALVVRAVKRGDPPGALLAGLLVVAPLAGILHWVESWLAHDVAYRLLTDMRLAVFRKLDALAPAYLTRRRSGDLVGAATHDVELIEYFFAHTITPAFVAVLVPAAVLVALGAFGAALVLVLVPFLLYTALVPVLGRGRIDRLGSRARRLRAVEAEPVPVRDGPGVPAVATRGAVAVELADVRFAYPSRPRPALDGVSLRIQDGSTVALVGPSGAGKTTVASLLLRFWDPQSGVIRLFGHDLREYQLDELRRRIALVAQDTYLFNDTLRANVLLARPDADDAALGVAIERAALGDLAASLPDRLGTGGGQRGAQLSGGQRQRVAIARAFLKDAPMLILDEATSHLDAVSEAAVRAALDRLARNRTTLVIAHRLSTVRDADAIVVPDDGRLVEVGRHAELLARGDLYAHLVARQLAVGAGSMAADRR